MHPLNFRQEDKPLLDASLCLAEGEHSNLTNVIRHALQEYVSTHSRKDDAPALDEFMKDPTYKALPPVTKLLSPEDLRDWSDETLLLFARNIRARRM